MAERDLGGLKAELPANVRRRRMPQPVRAPPVGLERGGDLLPLLFADAFPPFLNGLAPLAGVAGNLHPTEVLGQRMRLVAGVQDRLGVTGGGVDLARLLRGRFDAVAAGAVAAGERCLTFEHLLAALRLRFGGTEQRRGLRAALKEGSQDVLGLGAKVDRALSAPVGGLVGVWAERPDFAGVGSNVSGAKTEELARASAGEPLQFDQRSDLAADVGLNGIDEFVRDGFDEVGLVGGGSTAPQRFDRLELLVDRGREHLAGRRPLKHPNYPLDLGVDVAPGPSPARVRAGRVADDHGVADVAEPVGAELGRRVVPLSWTNTRSAARRLLES